MVIADVKDWTWVLERSCPECGLDTRAVDPADVAGRVRSTAAAWDQVSLTPVRPQPQTWSTLEYACHVRDTCRIYDRRLALMLTEMDPLYPNWDQDRTAADERYPEQDPDVVRRELQASAAALATRFDEVSGEQWQRPGRRSDGASFTVASFARYFLHDPVHHLWDVTGVQHPR